MTGQLKFLAAWFSAVLVMPALAQPVEVQQGQEIGAGYAFRRGEVCLLLTPLHVVPSAAADIAVLDRTGARNTAQRVYDNPAFDLALLEVNGRPTIACTERWPDSSWMAALNPSTRTVFDAIRHYPSGGRETVVALRYAGRTQNTLTLAPTDKTTIRETDSGAIVRLEDKLAGIVQRVDPATDRVEVLRFDVIDRLLGERFRGTGRSPLAVEGVRSHGQVNANWSAYLRNWVAEATGRNAVMPQDTTAKCRLAVDLMELRATTVPNPEFERASKQDCALMKLFGKAAMARCEEQKRRDMGTVQRTLAGYAVSAEVKVTPAKGPTLARVVSGTVTLDAKRSSRSIDEQFSALETVMAPTAKELITQAVCD